MPRNDVPILTWDQLLADAERLPEPVGALLVHIIEQHRPAPGVTDDFRGTRWYLERLAVEGFVGIGSPEVVLPFEPNAGLTVITARNGVGKSSFALALRHVLGGVGFTDEIGPKPRVRWRNVLADQLAISVTFRDAESSAQVTIQERGDGPVVADGDTSEPVDRSWTDAKYKYEPVLIYPEIAGAIDDDSLVNTAWANALPLEVLRTAFEEAGRIEREEKQNTGKLADALRKLRENTMLDPDFRERLPESIPPKHDGFDPSGLAGELEDRRARDRDKRVLYPGIPNALEERLGELSSALKNLEGSYRREAAHAWSLVRLYREALELATADDEEPCPLCDSTDRHWRARTERQLAGIELDHDGPGAVERFHHARDRTVSLLPDYTGVIGRLPGKLDERVRRLADRWRRLGDELRSLDVHTADDETLRRLRRREKEAAAAHEQLRDDVRTRSESAPREDARTALAEFLRDLAANSASVRRQRAAGDLKRHLNTRLRNARDVSANSLGEQARAHFERLCPDSPFELLNYTVAGGVERAKRMAASIRLPNGDGDTGTEILSTGQLNALCLSAFLPRTTRKENPFGFLVLDDPIHAFDGTRVDYLAQILSETSSTYQVIVFTHDERLPTVLDSSGTRFRRIDLTSADNGRVLVTSIRSVARGLLEDADEVAGRRDHVADSSLAVATLALCRQALDEAITGRYLRLQHALGRGAVSDTADGDRLSPEGLTTRDRWNHLNTLLDREGEPTIPVNDLVHQLNDGSHFKAPEICGKEVRIEWVRQTARLVEQLEGDVAAPPPAGPARSRARSARS